MFKIWQIELIFNLVYEISYVRFTHFQLCYNFFFTKIFFSKWGLENLTIRYSIWKMKICLKIIPNKINLAFFSGWKKKIFFLFYICTYMWDWIPKNISSHYNYVYCILPQMQRFFGGLSQVNFGKLPLAEMEDFSPFFFFEKRLLTF